MERVTLSVASQDVNSFVNGISTQQPISGTNNTYVVGTDGRGTAILNGATVEFALTSNQHAVLIRFDKNSTGSGTHRSAKFERPRDILPWLSGLMHSALQALI